MMYIDRLYAVPVQPGTKKLTLTILTHFRGCYPVHFEFYKNNDSWTVYWIAELPVLKLLAAVKANHIHLTKWEDSPNKQKLRDAILEISPMEAHIIDDDIAEMLQSICDNGLPPVKHIPSGKDGHSFSILIDEFEKEYLCWRQLPEEWSELKTIIDKCVEYAELDNARYGCYL